MPKEGDPYHRIEQLGRDSGEKLAELHACTDATERRVITMELHALARERRGYTEQAETLEQLPAVWETIYGAGDGYVALFSGRRSQKRLVQPRAGYFPYPDAIQDAQAWVRSAAAAGREVYHCAHLVTEPRRRKETAAPVSALWIDLDSGQLDTERVPTPTLLIESSPGKSQAYWQLTAPIPPPEAERLNRELAVQTGADTSGWDATQLLRVPGTRNHKYDDAPLVRVLAWYGRSYDPTVVANPRGDLPLFTAGRAERQPTPQPSGTSSPAFDELPLSKTARRIIAGELPKRREDGQVDRSSSLMQMAGVLAGAGFSRAAIAQALAERDETLGWRKYTDRDDRDRRYDRIAAVVLGQRRR
jgi:hypothetical protein